MYYVDDERREGDKKTGKQNGKGVFFDDNLHREIINFREGLSVILTKKGKVLSHNY